MSPSVRNVASIRGSNKKTKISVIILSAALSSKMRSYGIRSLLKIDNKFLMDYQLEVIKSLYPMAEIIMVTGYDADKVMNNIGRDVICVENERFDETNVARSLAIGLRAATTDKILVVYGDLLFNSAALSLDTKESSVVISTDASGDGFFNKDNDVGCNINSNGLVEHFSFDLPNKWCQVAYLTGAELHLLESIVWHKGRERLFGFEIMNMILDKGGSIRAVTPKDMKICDIDCLRDLENKNQIL